MNDFNVMILNEVQELRKKLNANFIKKRFRNKSKKIWLLLDLSEKLEFESIPETIIKLKIKGEFDNLSNLTIIFNSVTVFKENLQGEFDVELFLETEQFNSLELIGELVSLIRLELIGNIDFQKLNEVNILTADGKYFVVSKIGKRNLLSLYQNLEDLIDNFKVGTGNVIENFICSGSCLKSENGKVFNDYSILITGNKELGFYSSKSSDEFVSSNEIQVQFDNFQVLPIFHNYFHFGLISNEENKFHINYYDLNYQKVKSIELLFDLKYQVEKFGGLCYLDGSEFLNHGFWFIDKNNDAYIVLAKNLTENNILFAELPIYIGKVAEMKAYVNGSKLFIYLSYDNSVTKLVFNISNDGYSINLNRENRAIVKNVELGFYDEEDFYYTNDHFIKLT